MNIQTEDQYQERIEFLKNYINSLLQKSNIIKKPELREIYLHLQNYGYLKNNKQSGLMFSFLRNDRNFKNINIKEFLSDLKIYKSSKESHNTLEKYFI
jgi:hypothetical protein